MSTIEGLFPPYYVVTGTYTDGLIINEMFATYSDLKAFTKANTEIKVVIVDSRGVSSSNQPTTCYQLFQNCSNLVAIEMANCDVSAVKSVQQICSNCSSLVHIDLGSAELVKLNTTNQAFYNCTSLVHAFAYSQEDCETLNGSAGKASNVEFKIKF